MDEYRIRQGKVVAEAAEIGTNYTLGEIRMSGSDKQFLIDRLYRMQIMVEANMDGLVEAYDLDDPRDGNDGDPYRRRHHSL